MRNKVKDVNSHVKAIADSDITNHDIFNYIDFWTYSKVPTIQFSTEYRTAVFRKYLTIYLKSYKRKISDFVNSKEYQDMDDAKVWKALLDLIEGICNSRFYDSEKNFLKVYSILNILLSVLENTISNSESVCNSINGALKGLKFDGKVEP